MNYNEFLKTKKKSVENHGFNVSDLNPLLKDFQKDILKKSILKGRYAIFADCGMGKTFMQLEWANKIAEKENKPVLILSPLAVVQQTINEGDKFGIKIQRLKSDVWDGGVYITNFEQIDSVDENQFIAIAIDEASILKNDSGALKNKIISKFCETKYRSAWTATPSPNDHVELGNIAEFLGVMNSRHMVSEFLLMTHLQKMKLFKNRNGD